MAISKHDFDKYIANAPTMKCCDLLHPGVGCQKGLWRNIKEQIAMSNPKFFIPIYVIRFIFAAQNGVKMDSNYFLQLFRMYLRSIVYGMCASIGYQAATCALANIFKSVKYYNLTLMPGFVGGLSIIGESSQNVRVNTAAYAALVFEGYYRTVCKQTNKLRDTIVFMTFSSLVMFLMAEQHKPYVNLWFYRHRVGSQRAIGRFCLEGVVKYFLVGYAFSVIRKSVSCFHLLSKDWKAFLKRVFGENALYFGIFTGAYVGSFRLITSTLSLIFKTNASWHHLVAGFLAGSTFYAKPNLQLTAFCFITAIQMLLRISQKYVKYPGHSLYLLNALMFAYCLHIYMYHNPYSPKYLGGMLNGCSGNVGPNVYIYALREINARKAQTIQCNGNSPS